MSGQPTGDDGAEAPTEPSWPGTPEWPGRPVLARPAVPAPASPAPAGPAPAEPPPPHPDDMAPLPGGGLPRQDDGWPGPEGGWSRWGYSRPDARPAPDAGPISQVGPASPVGTARPGGTAVPAPDSGRPRSGALLPGEWARAGGPDGPAAPQPAGPRDRDPGSRLGRLVRGELRGGRLAVAAGLLALVCTTLGGVIGGYIALRAQNGPTDPSYNVGTVPAAVTGRPASSVAGIAARVTPSVVMIKVNGGEGTGSGFVIRGGYIVTDNHVVTLDNQVSNAVIRVYFSNGSSVPGRVVGRDPYADIAIIKADGVSRLPALTLGNSSSVAVGDPVIAVGSPLGLADTVTSGIVSAVDRPVQPGQTSGTTPQVFFDAIQTDAPINPGNSGGPLVNAKGQVIGVDAAIDTLGDNPLTGTQGGSIGLGFAIPINQARRVAVELIRTGHSTHAVLGAAINVGWGGNGAQVTSSKTAISPGGPAALAGIQRGDVIVRFAGQPVPNGNALLDAVRSATPGTKVSVTFVRAGQTHTATLRLGSAPS
jgi:putative serine protease PepD